MDSVSYAAQLEASRATGGLIPHPMISEVKGGPFTSAMQLVLHGDHSPPSPTYAPAPSYSAGYGGGRTSESDSFEGLGELIAFAFFAGIVYLVICWVISVRDEIATTILTGIAAVIVYKVSNDFEASGFLKHALTFLTVLAGAECVYFVAISRAPEGTLLSTLFRHAGSELIGSGLAIGSYFVFRDTVQEKIGWETWLKGAIGVMLVGGGIYMSGALDGLIKTGVSASNISLGNDDAAAANSYVITQKLNIRTAPGEDIISTLDCGASVHTKSGATHGWTEIVLPPDNRVAYVASRFLSEDAPSASQCSAPT